MNKSKKWFVLKSIQIMGKVAVAGALCFAAYIRFTRPELTEIQLFLSYWQVWVVAIAGVTAAGWAGAQ